MQGRLQLMGHIGRKLPAHGLGFLLICLLGLPGCNRHGNADNHQQNKTYRQRHVPDHHQNSLLGHTEAQDGAVRQPLSRIEHLDGHGARIPLALPIALPHGGLHFLTLQMIFHLAGSHVAVIQHLPIRRNPGHPVVFLRQLDKIPCLQLVHRQCRHLGLRLQLLPLHISKICKGSSHNQPRGKDKRHQGTAYNAQIPMHVEPPAGSPRCARS